MIPPIWFVELTRIDIANEKRRRLISNSSASNAASSGIEIENIIGLSQTLGLNQSILNEVIIKNIKLIFLFFKLNFF